MAHPSFQNIGAYIKQAFAVSATAVAAGAGDNTETNGSIVDRLGFQSAVLVLAAQATLSANKKATFKATIQDGDDASLTDAADIAAALQPSGAADSVVLTITDSGAGGTQKTSVNIVENLNLASLKRYLRAQVHVDLDAGVTDTAHYCAVWILGGHRELPQT